jgi:hypothetical protein
VELGGGWVYAQADAALRRLAASLGPGATERGIGDEGVEEALSIGCGIGSGDPGEDVSGEVPVGEFLLSGQGHFDRIAWVLASKDTDFQVNETLVNRMIRHLITSVSNHSRMARLSSLPNLCCAIAPRSHDPYPIRAPRGTQDGAGMPLKAEKQLAARGVPNSCQAITAHDNDLLSTG